MTPGKPQEVLEEAEQDALLRASAEPDLLRSGRAMIVPAGQLLRRIRAPLLTIATFRGDPAVRARIIGSRRVAPFRHCYGSLGSGMKSSREDNPP